MEAVKPKRKRRNNKRYDYIIYTDGGCSPNPGGPGGCAAIILNKKTGKKTTVAEGYKATSNNRMELMAAIIALEQTPKKAKICLYSDSQYMVNCFSGEWKKKTNMDLWDKLLVSAKRRDVKMRWIRGHAGNDMNELCDKLATTARKNAVKEDVGFGAKMQAAQVQTIGLKNDAKDVREPMRERGKVESIQNIETPLFEDDIRSIMEIHNVNQTCAKSIYTFRKSSKTIDDYTRLRSGGCDAWSKKTYKALLQLVETHTQNIDKIKDAVKMTFPEEKDAASCLRWFMRGLDLEEAITKAQVDKNTNYEEQKKQLKSS